MDEGSEVLVVNEPQSANRFFNELIFDAVLGSHLAVQNREFDFVLVSLVSSRSFNSHLTCGAHFIRARRIVAPSWVNVCDQVMGTNDR